jgi:hypothetical protein
MMWHKARAQPSQGVAGRPCIGAFPKTILSMCPAEAVLKVSNAQAWCNVTPRSETVETKPPYVCPGCLIHTYSNNVINRCHNNTEYLFRTE